MSQPSPASFLWHDYETWGVSPQKDMPSQFAAIRTDADLNEIGKPINILCQIANDYLPQPQAALVTGLTPQHTLRDGMTEADFAAKIQQAMMEPGTCVVGYNSIRFDDEVSRYLFYRNFYDPYAREWQNGNSRWDIIDLVRACYALRPDGIEWPLRDDGSPSFKLELLTAANGIDHGHAHDALSDVRATIALARLIKTKQPKLFEFALSLRQKANVLKQINLQQLTPLVHVSSKIPASQGCCTWILPVAQHPTNPNAIITVDLQSDPTPILELDTESLKARLYRKQEDMQDGELRPGIKLIHINRSPFVTTAKALTEDTAARLGLDREQCLAHYRQLVAHTSWIQKLVELYHTEHDELEQDPDHALYSGGFLTNEEKHWCTAVRESAPEQLVSLADKIHNPTLKSQLFRYRARNYPNTLTYEESQKWQRHRQFRLTDPASPASITLEAYLFELEKLAEQHADNAQNKAILKALYAYAQNL
ncbi:exodeoxyribonuclease I [Aestuariibacter sp. GS-14]|uniref:exodeoxyribonuclease I n=1 Tax=Aestuariibacter sp. GS-14 TaxID=2590670 RepID=UPI00112891E2|nr:exodeoxyribonuclease I [Aestuariibacter sp. GS-14]TPV59741.1 exodeoxyribonuclease I [Aestuariibacter sp. GS-14]